MDRTESLLKQIAQAEVVVSESRENLEKHPGEYSARLLLLSMENHLADLLRELDAQKPQQEG